MNQGNATLHNDQVEKHPNEVQSSPLKDKKVLIMAGGTGGHVFPGLALAYELINRGADVEWMGTQAGIESRLVPSANITLKIFPVSGIRGKGLLALFNAPINILRAICSAWKLLKTISPDLVIGMGGFVAGPGAIAAKLRGVPLLIHEQNAVPGTTNRLLSPFADVVISAFPVKLSRAQVLGNPVRSEIEILPEPDIHRSINAGRFNVLIVGGSRGALAINQFFPKVFKEVLRTSVEENKILNLDIWHQSGGGKGEATVAAYAENSVRAKVEPFIDDMASAYGWADLIICRSGALTVSEIAAVGLPSILVPFPYAIDDHQTANAEYLSSSDAALIIQETEFDERVVAKKISSLLFDPSRLISMAKKSRSLAKPDAAKKVVDICGGLMND